MPVYLVRCAPRDRERGLGAVDAKLSTLAECLRPLPDTWIVEDATSASLIHSMLRPDLAPGDAVLVLRCGSEASWDGIESGTDAWFGDRFTRDQ